MFSLYFAIIAIRLYQVGNTSSSKNTEVKQFGSIWMSNKGMNVDAAATTLTVKSPIYASAAQTKVYLTLVNFL